MADAAQREKFPEEGLRREELGALFGELRALREESARRAEAIAQQLEALTRKLCAPRFGIPALSARAGDGREQTGPGIVERLTLTDTAGEIYGIPGAQVECDLVVSDGIAYVVEVKAHPGPDDVFTFHRKAGFASRQLDRPLRQFMIVAGVEEGTEALLRRLGIDFIIQSRLP